MSGATISLMSHSHLNNTLSFCFNSPSLNPTPRFFPQINQTRRCFRPSSYPRSYCSSSSSRSRIVCGVVEDSKETSFGITSAVEDRPNEIEKVNPDSGKGAIYDFLYPSKDDLPDDQEMTIFDHLEELRQRMFVSVLGVGAAILGCFAFSKDLILILEAPVKVQGVRFLQLAPGEFFFTTLKIGIFI